MSAKETVAVGQLLELLESRYAIRVLWALRDGHAQTFRLLQDSVGGITPNTLNTRIKELREAGLITHGGDGYHLTPAGAELTKRLADLPAFAAKWATGLSKKTKCSSESVPKRTTISNSANGHQSSLPIAGQYAVD